MPTEHLQNLNLTVWTLKPKYLVNKKKRVRQEEETDPSHRHHTATGVPTVEGRGGKTEKSNRNKASI